MESHAREICGGKTRAKLAAISVKFKLRSRIPVSPE